MILSSFSSGDTSNLKLAENLINSMRMHNFIENFSSNLPLGVIVSNITSSCNTKPQNLEKSSNLQSLLFAFSCFKLKYIKDEGQIETSPLGKTFWLFLILPPSKFNKVVLPAPVFFSQEKHFHYLNKKT